MPTETTSIPGRAIIKHEAGDTLRRTITLKSGGVAVNLTGATIQMYVSLKENDTPIETLTVSSGLVASDLAGGEFRIHWQTIDVLLPHKTYYYKIEVTFPSGVVKTYLEDKIRTL